MTLHICQLYKG